MDTGAYMQNQMGNLIEAGIQWQEMYRELKCLIGDDFQNEDPNDLNNL